MKDIQGSCIKAKIQMEMIARAHLQDLKERERFHASKRRLRNVLWTRIVDLEIATRFQTIKIS